MNSLDYECIFDKLNMKTVNETLEYFNLLTCEQSPLCDTVINAVFIANLDVLSAFLTTILSADTPIKILHAKRDARAFPFKPVQYDIFAQDKNEKEYVIEMIRFATWNTPDLFKQEGKANVRKNAQGKEIPVSLLQKNITLMFF